MMNSKIVLQRPLRELKARKYADAILYSIDALDYPGLSGDEQYFVYLIIIEAYLRLGDHELAGQNIDAISSLTASKKLQLQYYLLKSELDINKGNYSAAIEILNDFDFEAAYFGEIGNHRVATCKYLKGVAFLRLGSAETAVEHLREAVQLFDDKLSYLICSAYIAVVENNRSALYEAAAYLLEGFPAYPGLIQLCANLAILMENDARAVVFAEKCQEFSEVFARPNNAEQLARTYARFGMYEEAALAFGDAKSEMKSAITMCGGQYVQTLDSNAEIKNDIRAVCAAASGQKNEAVKRVDELLASKTPENRLAAAACFVLLGEPGKAVKIIKTGEWPKTRIAAAMTYASAVFAQQDYMQAYLAALVAQCECEYTCGRCFYWAEITVFALEALKKVYAIAPVDILAAQAHALLSELESAAKTLRNDGLSKFAAESRALLHY